MIKRFLIAALCLTAIIFGGSGCMFSLSNPNQPTEPSQNANELALAYLEEKYGEPFYYSAPYGDSMTGTRSLLVTCNSFPDQQLLVQVEGFKTNQKVFLDNYLAVKYQSETIDFLHACISEHYPNANIFYEAPLVCQSANLSAAASFEEFLADGRAKLIVMLEVNASEFTGPESINEIVTQITESCNHMTLTVIVVDDSLFGTMDRSELNNRISHRDYVAMGKVYIDQNGVETKWRGEGIANG